MPGITDYESKRKNIIEKSKIVFQKHGYHNTSLFHISEECGIGRTTLYQYFKNKDEIFYCTISNTLEEIQNELEVIVNDNRLTFLGKLKEIIRQLTMGQNNNKTFLLLLEIWLILERENNEVLEGLRVHTEKLKNTIENLIKQGIDAKEIKPIDSKSLTQTLYTFIETFTLKRTSKDLNVKFKTEAIDLLIDGLKA